MESELTALKTELEATRTERDRLAQLHTQALARIAELEQRWENHDCPMQAQWTVQVRRPFARQE